MYNNSMFTTEAHETCFYEDIDPNEIRVEDYPEYDSVNYAELYNSIFGDD